MRVLELFSGENASFATAARQLGHEATTLDFNPRCKADICEDIRTWDYENYPTPDFCWASPDCREVTRVRSQVGDLCFADEVAQRTVVILRHFAARGCQCLMENPSGALGFRPWVKDLVKQDVVRLATVDDCQYSDDPPANFAPSSAGRQDVAQRNPYRKATDLFWFSACSWQPRARCRQNHCRWVDEGGRHRCEARRSVTPAQAIINQSLNLPYTFNTVQLHRVPHQLCREILAACVPRDDSVDLASTENECSHPLTSSKAPQPSKPESS